MSNYDYDLNSEILECARYGEDEDLLAIIDAGGDVNTMDEFGNTALHKAAANGHINCLKILKSKGAIYIKNLSGNYPTHWAAQNGQKEALEYLLQAYESEVDVLIQNEFGRSIITEAFGSNNSDVIEVCLSHPSSSEERLLNSTINNKSNDNDESLDNAVHHEFKFNSQSNDILKIRELPIERADNPFGSETSPEEDTTGLAIWPAAVLAGRWIATNHINSIQGKVVLELGAGCAVPGLAAAVYCQPKTVYVSDINTIALDNAIYNIKQNGQLLDSLNENVLSEVIISNKSHDTTVRVIKMNWLDQKTFPSEPIDVIIGSDLVYDRNILAALTFAIGSTLLPGGLFLYVAPDENRDGLVDLTESLSIVNINLISKSICPDELYDNPLVGENNDDNYVLHFYDLPAKKQFSLYVYQKQ